MKKKKPTELDWMFVEQYAKHDMNVEETARENFVASTTARYHLDKVREITGLSPYKFYELVELLKMKDGESDG